MANGHKVKFYLNANDTRLLEAVVDIINRDPTLNFDLNSFAKACVLRQGQQCLDEIRAIQKEKANESTPKTKQTEDSNTNKPLQDGESQEIQSPAQN